MENASNRATVSKVSDINLTLNSLSSIINITVSKTYSVKIEPIQTKNSKDGYNKDINLITSKLTITNNDITTDAYFPFEKRFLLTKQGYLVEGELPLNGCGYQDKSANQSSAIGPGKTREYVICLGIIKEFDPGAPYYLTLISRQGEIQIMK